MARPYEEAIRLLLEVQGEEEIADLTKRIKELASGSDIAADQATQLVDELQKLATTSNNIRDFTKLKATVTETAGELEKARARMHALAGEIAKSGTPTQKMQRDLQRAAAQVTELTKEHNRQQVALQRTSGALRAAGIDTDRLADAYQNVQDQVGAFSEKVGGTADAARKAGKETKAAAGGVSALDPAAEKGGRSLASMATRLAAISAAATAAIKGMAALSGAALFKGGIRSAVELEQALSEVRAVSGATAEELNAMKLAAEAGGRATRFNALEAAQGLGELARATGSAQTAIAALPATLSLAQAAGIGVAEAAQFIVTTLTQYGLAADQAGRISDVLAHAANATTADVQGLGNALSYAAPLAKQLGMDAEETVAIIGALADQGFRGERAGTALRNVLTSLQDPSSAFAKELRALGISTTDFVEILEALKKSGKDGERALLSLDAAARPAIVSLVEGGTSRLRELDAALRASAGSAEETARVMGDNLSGAVEAIQDSFDRTRRSLVEPLLEPLKEELRALATELETFAASPEFEEIKGALKDLFTEGAAAARELIKETDFAALARSIRENLGEAGETISAFRENLGTVITAVQLIGTTFSTVFNGVQAAVLLLASAVSRLVSIAAHVHDAITGPTRAFLEFIGVIREGQGDLSEFAGGMGAVADEFAERFANNLGEAIDAAKGFGDVVGTSAGSAATGLDSAAAAADRAATASTNLTDAANDASTSLNNQAASALASAEATGSYASKAELDAERIAKAFADMGLASQRDLNRAAATAKENFEIIRQAAAAGGATAEDVRRAFARYAEAARAAVADSDESARARVEAELAVLDAIVNVNAALDDQAEAGKKAAQAVSQVASGTLKAGAAAQGAAKKTETFRASLRSMSDEAIQALLSLNKYAGSKLWAQMWNRQMAQIDAQYEAIARVNDELDAQLARMDPLADKLEKLKGQYEFVDDATRLALAQKQQQVEDEVDRRREEAKRERQRILEEAEADAQAARDRADEASGGNRGLTRSLQNFGTIRIELPDGTNSDLLTNPDGALTVQRLIDELSRSKSVSMAGLRRR